MMAIVFLVNTDYGLYDNNDDDDVDVDVDDDDDDDNDDTLTLVSLLSMLPEALVGWRLPN